MKKVSQGVLWSVLVLGVIAGVLVCALLWLRRPYATVARFKLPSGEEIVILKETYWEVTVPVLGVVTKGKETMVEPIVIMYLGSYTPNPKLELVVVPDCSVVAIVEADIPSEVLMLHDQATGANWPRCKMSDDWQQCRERGSRLLAELNECSPDIVYSLRVE